MILIKATSAVRPTVCRSSPDCFTERSDKMMAFVLAVLKETQSGEQRSAVAPSTSLHLQKIEADIRIAPI
ncbi:hypothetical protein [Acidisoma sp. C75]